MAYDNPLDRPLRASEKTERITLQTRTVTKDGAAWSGSTQYWAKIEGIGATRLSALATEGSPARVRFSFSPGIALSVQQLIVCRSKNYLIETVDPRPQRTICECVYVA